MDNLKRQGSISTEVLGVSFRPESGSDTDDTNGELTLGGTDSSKYTGSLVYVPKLTSGDASAYWGVSIASFSYGSKTLETGATGIVDTGTTLIYIPTSAYNAFLSASGGKTDSNSGLSSWTTKPTQNFAIKLGSTSYTLTPAQYLVPTSQYGEFGLSSGKYYCKSEIDRAKLVASYLTRTQRGSTTVALRALIALSDRSSSSSTTPSSIPPTPASVSLRLLRVCRLKLRRRLNVWDMWSCLAGSREKCLAFNEMTIMILNLSVVSSKLQTSSSTCKM